MAANDAKDLHMGGVTKNPKSVMTGLSLFAQSPSVGASGGDEQKKGNGNEEEKAMKRRRRSMQESERQCGCLEKEKTNGTKWQLQFPKRALGEKEKKEEGGVERRLATE